MKSFLFILVALVAYASAAHAQGYHCKLPLLMGSEIANGTPHAAVNSDQTIDFQVRITPSGEKALIEGNWFAVIQLPKMKSFIDIENSGAVYGFDILSIYDTRVEGGFYASETRHILINGVPMVELMVGACSPT